MGVRWGFPYRPPGPPGDPDAGLDSAGVLVLRYFEDLDEAETAAVLGVSVGTVKSAASRALARLRQSGVFAPAARAGASDAPTAAPAATPAITPPEGSLR